MRLLLFSRARAGGARPGICDGMAQARSACAIPSHISLAASLREGIIIMMASVIILAHPVTGGPLHFQKVNEMHCLKLCRGGHCSCRWSGLSGMPKARLTQDYQHLTPEI